MTTPLPTTEIRRIFDNVQHAYSIRKIVRKLFGRLIKEELEQSDKLDSIIFDSLRYDFFRSRIEFGNFDDNLIVCPR